VLNGLLKRYINYGACMQDVDIESRFGSPSSDRQDAAKPPPIAQQEGEGLHCTPGQYLDKALNLVGLKLRQAASAVREHTPNEGLAKSVASSTSSALDATGRFILGEGSADGASGVVGDVTGVAGSGLERSQISRPVVEELRAVVRRYPLRALAASALVGFILGDLMRD
jgi:hypothetical protein